MESFVLLAYASLAASRTLLKQLLACLNFTLDSEDLSLWYKRKNWLEKAGLVLCLLINASDVVHTVKMYDLCQTQSTEWSSDTFRRNQWNISISSTGAFSVLFLLPFISFPSIIIFQ